MFRYYSEHNDTIIASSDTIVSSTNCECDGAMIRQHLPCKRCKCDGAMIKQHLPCKKCTITMEDLIDGPHVVCLDCLAVRYYSRQMCPEIRYHITSSNKSHTRCYMGHGFPHLCYPHMCCYKGVTVQVHGSPITVNPKDATYRVRIWELTAPENECTAALFTDEDMIVEFSISPTEDPIDVERRYGMFFRKYDVLNVNTVEYNFSAPKNKQKYIEQFLARIRTMLKVCKNGPAERVAMDPDNGHISQRIKGFSHAETH